MARQVHLPNNWTPRGYQLPLWEYLENGGTRALSVWHRRSGKDEVGLHWTACASQERVGTYWYMLPQAAQARKAIWKAVNPHTGLRRIDEAFPPELRASVNDQEMFITFKVGSTWQVLGSDNYNSYVGSPPVGIVLSEWALSDPAAWAYVRPILLENGGWAYFNSTPRGRNHLHTFYKRALGDRNWFTSRLTAHQTPVFTAEALERELEELKGEYGEDIGTALFNQEYLCSFDSAVIGSIYGGYMSVAEEQGRITKVPWEPELPVFTGWDLGIRDDSVIVFAQVCGREVHIIDFYRSTDVGMEHYAKMLRSKPYTYQEHYLPHDGGQRELGPGKTRKETLEGLGVNPVTVLDRVQKKTEHYQMARSLLPRCWFDADKTEYLVESLRAYARKWDEKKRDLADAAEHNWASHPADAFATLAQGLDLPPPALHPRARRYRQPVAITDYDPLEGPPSDSDAQRMDIDAGYDPLDCF